MLGRRQPGKKLYDASVKNLATMNVLPAAGEAGRKARVPGPRVPFTSLRWRVLMALASDLARNEAAVPWPPAETSCGRDRFDSFCSNIDDCCSR